MKYRHLMTGLVIFIMAIQLVFAGTTGKVSGVVTDAVTGEPLPGVNVIIQGTNYGTATDLSGNFYILNVPPGIVSVDASFIGYARMTIQEVRVVVDMTTTTNIAMQVEALQGQSIVVVETRPLVDNKSTNERRTIRSEDIANLPVRDADEIVALQTGAVKVGNNLHIRGGRLEEVAYYVDGVYQVNDYSRVARPNAAEVSSQALEELSFQAGGFDAEYGSATAGLINMSTKTGGRKFTIAGEIATDEFLPSEDGGKLLDKSDDGFLRTYSYGQNIYNLSINGPILPDLTFYLNAEYQYNLDRRTTSGSHPDAEYLGDLDTNGYATYDEYEVSAKYGPLPNNSETKLLATGNILYAKRNLRIKLGGNIAQTRWNSYGTTVASFDKAAFALESIPLWESETQAGYIRGTWTINSKTLLDFQVSSFTDGYETGHEKLWDDFFYYGLKEFPVDALDALAALDDDDRRQMLANEYAPIQYIIDNRSAFEEVDGNLVYQPALGQNGTDPSTIGAYADFSAPGTINSAFAKNKTGYWGMNSNLKMQRGVHELKIGGEFRQYLIRYYRLGAPERLASTFFNNTPRDQEAFVTDLAAGDLALGDYTEYQDYIDNYWFQAYKNAYSENMGYSIDGSSLVNTDLGDDRDGARRPTIGGVYVQDKVEMSDLIMNIGLRYDYIAGNNFQFRDPAKIILDQAGAIAEQVYMDEDGVYSSYEPTETIAGVPVDVTGTEQLALRDPIHIISPRLGLAFPVTDRTVFHAQYGKYVQQPQLNRLFLSYTRFAANLSQGNYTTSGNPELEPVRTTSYEIGFQQAIGDAASLDMTVFYKQMTGYVQIRNVQDATPVIYARYINGDFGSIKGLSASFNLRRTGYVQAILNYTLQYAGGTGSTGAGQYKIAWQSGNYPSFVSPLDFDQRHTGSLNVDFRTTSMDRIPEAGANLLFTFGSGRRYTPMAINSAVFPGTSDTPVAALNSGVMPWFYQMDLKLDKNFTVGPLKLNTYIWIKNLLDRANVRDVEDGTGEANNDGWLTTDYGKAWLADENNSEELYRMRMIHPFNYENPRTFLLGVRFFMSN
ncbi:MAG: TonB-dependent receptor [Candidatus Marinimicrobia bacterium]|nr:TonB-dependent receptor [Candidatus Neomarinimicrobiota bacterium]